MVGEENRDLDQELSRWLKKMPLDEPSASFSGDVMRSVYALRNEKPKFNFWWFLLALPVLVAVGWYLTTLPQVMEKFLQIQTSTLEFFSSLFGSVKKISVSPLVILVFLAILSLLIIEDIFGKSRSKLRTDSHT